MLRLPDPKKSKYRNKRIIGGYQSRKEASRAQELKLLEKAGKIRNLKEQTKWILIPAQYDKKNGRCLERAVKYFADFSYYENDQLVVEDVKSEATKTTEYVLKRKMMLYFHGIRITEV